MLGFTSFNPTYTVVQMMIKAYFFKVKNYGFGQFTLVPLSIAPPLPPIIEIASSPHRLYIHLPAPINLQGKLH
jgi:hypothetical protein